MRFDTFVELAKLSFAQPANAAQELFSIRLSKEVIWSALFLFTILSTLILWGIPPGIGLFQSGPLSGPVPGGVAMLAFTVISSAMILMVGRVMGATGQFRDVLQAETWVLGLRVPILFATQILANLSPGFASVFSLLAGLTLFWVSLNFLTVALGLGSLWKTFLALVGAAFASAVLLVMALSMLGFTPQV